MHEWLALLVTADLFIVALFCMKILSGKTRERFYLAFYAFGKILWMLFDIVLLPMVTDEFLFDIVYRTSNVFLLFGFLNLFAFGLTVYKGNKFKMKALLFEAISLVVALVIALLPVYYTLKTVDEKFVMGISYAPASLITMTIIAILSTVAYLFPAIVFLLKARQTKNELMSLKAYLFSIFCIVAYVWGFSTNVTLLALELDAVANILEGLIAPFLILMLFASFVLKGDIEFVNSKKKKKSSA